MPEAFIKAEKEGAKIITVSGPSKKYGLAANQYIHIAYLHGKAIPGEVHVKKGKE